MQLKFDTRGWIIGKNNSKIIYFGSIIAAEDLLRE
jgi:hypothetical protein